MPRLLAIAIFLLSVGIQGCQKVQPIDLIGTWVMKDTSRQSLPTELQKASGKIVLDANGTFVASDVPGLFYFPERRPIRLESGNGVWKLVSREGKQQVQLEFQTITEWKDALPYGTQLDVSSGNLFYFLGDADEGKRVSLEKK